MEWRNPRSTNERWYPNRVGSKPGPKTYEVLDANEGCPVPFYVYGFNVSKVQDTLDGSSSAGELTDYGTGVISRRIRDQVLASAINSWLEANQPEHSLHLVSPTHDKLVTQFAFRGEQHSERNSYFEQQVTVENDVLVGSEFVRVQETYSISFSYLIPPVRDLRSAKGSWEVCSAIKSMILADIEADERFASTRSNQVYKLANVEEDRRNIKLVRPHLRMTLGLLISINQLPTGRVSGELDTLLTIYENWNLFFEPVGMIQLLHEYFEFDISAPLQRGQIERVKSELQWQTIEMRVESSANHSKEHDNKPEAKNYITCIKDVSLLTVAEELSEVADQSEELAPTGEMTVERQFIREFPSVELKYTHLPCLISPQGRKIPIEVCWIWPGRRLERLPKLAETWKLKQMTHHERLGVFEKNCHELTRDYCSTLGKFGFKLRQV